VAGQCLLKENNITMNRIFFTNAVFALVICLLSGCATDLPLTELKKYDGVVGYGMVVSISKGTHVLQPTDGLCSVAHDHRCTDDINYRGVAVWMTNGFPKLTQVVVYVPADVNVEQHDIIKYIYHPSNDPKRIGYLADYLNIIKVADQGPSCEWKGPGLMLHGHVECDGWNPFVDKSAGWLNL